MQIREDHNIPFIPYDILANILRRLPVKSLIRFKCVSKDWENLIKSPSFIRDCLHHTSRPTPLLLLSHLALTPRYRFQLLDRRSKQVFEIQNPPLIDCCSDLKIVGSCNGLVCLQVFNEDYALSLPCHSNDSVEVYSLNSGSWEEVEFENLEGTIRISSWTNVAVNGVVYWLGGKQRRSDDYDYSLVVSIDLTNQVCTSIPLPDLGSKKSRRLKLILYENKLAVLAITKSSLIHLWVMEEDTCASRGRWIWTKRYTCSLCSTRLSPSELNAVTIWKNEIVSRPIRIDGDADETKRFCLLDLTRNEFKEFVIKCGRYNAKGIYNYVESHVSVANINYKEL
ncbi:hypothetical protein K1719_001928 [Acacia pycnantha]|nr:hypothetical protein K1719_001928 [Acacia pycnantha]